MPHLEWWQALAALGGFLVALDRAAGVLERLGGVYGTVGRWLRRTYQERIDQEKRDAALTALITNGINEKVELVGTHAAVAVERAEVAVTKAAQAVQAASELAALVEVHRINDREALNAHITQSMEEHSAITIQLKKLTETKGDG